jgi:hypothetical protein
MIGPPQQDLGWQVPALFSAQRAGDHNRLKRELLHPGRHIPLAPLALHNEQLPILESKCHKEQYRQI